jgi:HK97 family phage prohead protease
MTLYRTTVSAGEGMDFVLSDGSLDRHGTRINPRGWEVGKYLPALFGHAGIPIGRWENVRVDGDKLRGRLAMAAKGTSARIDELRSLVEQGILRAVSVGFEVLDLGKPGQSEFDYERQQLVEASLVTIPSNPNALAQARSLNISDDTLGLVFGEQAARPAKANGGHAATSPTKATKMETSISSQIESAQNSLNAAHDALSAHLALNADDFAQTDKLNGDVEQRKQLLASLQRAERNLGQQTIEVRCGEQKLPAPHIARPSLTSKRDTRPVKGDDLCLREGVVRMRAVAFKQDPIRVLEDSYGDHEATQIYVRAAISGATTTTAGWAAELVQTANVDFLGTLGPDAVFPRLAALGTPLPFGPGAGAIKIPSRASTPSIGGSFVAEGGAIPVRRVGLTSITLSPTKMGVVSVFTREMAAYSNPAIEGMLRAEIVNDTRIAIDTILIDATAATTGLRPAGLRSGISGLTAATGGGYAAILKDVTALTGPFHTANAGRQLVLIMNPREALSLAMSPGPDGTLGWTSAFMGQFTVLVSSTVTAGMLIMVDAADFVAVSAQPEFEASEHATIHMEDTTPLNIATGAQGSGVLATPTQSMFQTASVALRMLLPVTWAMRRTGMVQWQTGTNWALA